MPLLEVKNVKKYFGNFCALAGVSFSVEPGEYVAIIGPNGAGKTTLINIISGYLKPSSGDVYFKGRRITGLKPEKILRMGIARSFQLVTIFPNLTVLDCLRVAILSRTRRTSRMLSLIDEDVTKEAKEIASIFGLDSKLHIQAKNLSHGDKKLLDVATALALHPELILLDEPTSGVSTGDKFKVMDKLIEACKEMGVKSLVLVEHDLDIVFSYSKRIIVLYQGRVLADGTPSEVESNEEVARKVLGVRR